MSQTPPSKKRGAPPGNHNALRHGAYARRTPSTLADHSPEPDSEPARSRLSLVREISYLRAYFFRLSYAGAVDADSARVGATLRSLSIGAVAITRLIQTENWLAQTSGAQVQYDRLPQAADDIQSILDRYISRHSERAAMPQEDPDLEPEPEPEPDPDSLIPGIELMARQLGIPVSELIAGLYSPSQSDTPPAYPPPA